ncbi:MAG TPA: hypothetical protein LFW20_04805 [Rickettsia endosymbiont of Omalisus fontisbellaquei]|nr:hypothetical protein [Rickettsia endosymbiont of Omalisus fontisbellaquei]
MEFSYYTIDSHKKVFYIDYTVDFLRKEKYLREEVKYNRELLLEHYKEELEYIEDEDKKLEEIDRIFWESLNHWLIYFEPLIYNEEIALRCGLIPFEYQGKKLLAFSAYKIDLVPRMDLRFRLDAYRLLTFSTIDRKSRIFTCPYYRKYFKNIVGEEITKKILQINKDIIKQCKKILN